MSIIKPHTIEKMVQHSTKFPCECSLPVTVRDLAKSHGQLRALARELADFIERGSYDDPAGWDMDSVELLARPDVQELEG